MSRTYVIIPAHNEAGRIGRTLNALFSVLPEARVLIIDDGSTDGTAEEARQAGCELIQHSHKQGYCQALLSGYHWATSRDITHIIQMDADGQHDPDSIPALLEAFHSYQADLIIGSRFNANKLAGMSLVRRIGNAWFSFMLRLLAGKKIRDCTSGFQVLRRSVLDFYLSGAFPRTFPDANILLSLQREGFRIIEIPARFHPSPFQKKGGMHSGFNGLKYAVTMSLDMIRRRCSPAHWPDTKGDLIKQINRHQRRSASK